MIGNHRTKTFLHEVMIGNHRNKTTESISLHNSCWIFCDLLLKSAFEQIFNVMQLILVKSKWKYLIQKFHDICLSYYFK
jgi:hypothetical protein